VVAHLIGTNHFWAASIASGLSGEPTRILASFDPVATPARMVESMRDLSPQATFEQLVDSQRVLLDAVEALDDTGWSAIAESPVGHVPIRLLVSHALWDSWVHERDVLVPLDIQPDEEPDEVLACLSYVAALAPAFALSAGGRDTGTLVIDVVDPAAHVVVAVDGRVDVHDGPAPEAAAVLSGNAVDIVEMLSIRARFDQPIADEHRWLVGGLAAVFDAPLARG
jgi:hypothetical protein